MLLRDQMTVGIGYAQAFTARSKWEVCLQVQWDPVIKPQFPSTQSPAHTSHVCGAFESVASVDFNSCFTIQKGPCF